MSDSAADKNELARANTMQATAKEGEAFLDKNLTEWKKPVLMEHFDEGKGADEHNGESSKVQKFTTMTETAEEAKALLGGEVLGDTRQETKKRQSREKSSNKRASTIDKVLQEAKAVYTDLDTSSEGRSLRKRAPPPPAKDVTPPVKRAGTMARTAKEGEEFVKRGKGKTPAKKGAKKGGAGAEEDEEKEDAADEEEHKATADNADKSTAAKTNDKAAAAAPKDTCDAAGDKATPCSNDSNAKLHDGAVWAPVAAIVADDRCDGSKDAVHTDGAAAPTVGST